ncbi:MAG: hypothetical protein HYV27_08900 [Candidatus Hydrogenedentes bacterium]|nr:hypothetical protein [Candidatus Hydrogenedentota bacterium]
MIPANRIVSITLCQAAALMMAGLLWGVILPIAPHARLGLGAHIQFTGSAVMLAAAAFCIHHLKLGSGRAAQLILAGTPWLIWPMTLSEVANAWWGTAKMLPVTAAEAGVSGGTAWQEAIVSGAHIIGGTGQIAFWAVILAGAVGALRSRES